MKNWKLYFRTLTIITCALILLMIGSSFYSAQAEEINDEKYDLSKAEIGPIEPEFYTGTPKEPIFYLYLNDKYLTEGIDYEAKYQNNINSGTATVHCIGIGNYTGRISTTFQIKKMDLRETTVAEIPDQIYTGMPIHPVPKIFYNMYQLTGGIDYTYTIKNNTEIGTATIIITGKNNCTGNKTVTFRIVGTPIDTMGVRTISSQTYTGKELKPEVILTDNGNILRPDIDYTIQYENNIQIGTAQVKLTGIGAYSGSQTVSFDIVGKDIKNCSVSSIPAQLYTKKAITPTVQIRDEGVLLKERVDYLLSYENNIKPGTAQIQITGTGTYQGTVIKNFQIQNPSSAKLKNTARLTKNNVKLSVGKKYQIAYQKSLNKKWIKSYRYITQNSKIASVSRKGIVLGRKKGTTKIVCEITFRNGVKKKEQLIVNVR